MTYLNKLYTTCALTAFMALPIAPAAVNAADEDENLFALDEIIVSARKTEQSLQDTSIAITAFDNQQILDSGFNNILDVAKASPGLFIESYNDRNARISTSPRFRGVVVDNGDPLLRTASVFIDGVYVVGGLQGINVQELERVEIIKGPQSALFGRNTFAGAINYVTKDPGDELQANISALAATRDEYRGSFGIEGPISDTIRFRINASYDFVGGHYTNANDVTQELGEESTWAISGTLLFEPNENFRVKIRNTYYEDDDGPAAVVRVGGAAEHNFGGFPDGMGGTTETAFQGRLRIPTADEIAANTSANDFTTAITALNAGGTPTILGISYDDLGKYGLKRKAYRGSLDAEYAFDNGVTFNMLFGYNDEEFLFFGDFDSTGDFSFNTSTARSIEDISIEARLSGRAFDEKLLWKVGANYVDIDILTTGGFYDGILDFWFPDVYSPANFTGAKTFGIFGILDYQITDQFKIILEGRYQEDEISDDSVNAGLAEPISPGTFTKFLPRVVVEFTPNDDTLLYANYSVGNLPGGFNSEVAELDAAQLVELEADNPGVGVTFGEEKLENFELGWKQYFLDKRGLINVAAFYMKRSDQIFSGFAFITETDPDAANPTRTVAFTGNGATTDIYGIEVESAFNVTERFSVQANLAYIDATIASFPEGAGSGDFGDVFGDDANVEGQEAPRFPRWSWSVNATYEHPISANFLGMDDAVWFTRGDLFYTGSFYDSNTNLAETPVAYDANLRTGIRDENTSIEIFVTNIFDEDAPSTANNIADTSFDVRFTPGGLFNFSNESIHLGLRKKRQFGIRLNTTF